MTDFSNKEIKNVKKHNMRAKKITNGIIDIVINTQTINEIGRMMIIIINFALTFVIMCHVYILHTKEKKLRLLNIFIPFNNYFSLLHQL